MLIDEGLVVRRNGGRGHHRRMVAGFPAAYDSRAARRPAGAARRQRAGQCSSAAQSRARSFIAEPCWSYRRRRDRARLDGRLQALSQQELIQPGRADFADEKAFRFRHQLLRDVAYESLSKTVRGELHERFAGWLENKTAERAEEFDEILGYHLQQAYRCKADLGPVDEHGREPGRRVRHAVWATRACAPTLAATCGARASCSRAPSLWRPGTTSAELLPKLDDALFETGERSADDQLGIGPLLLAPAARSPVGIQAAGWRNDAALRLLRQGQAASGPGRSRWRVHRLRAARVERPERWAVAPEA